MELSQPISHASIPRDGTLPISQDYHALLEQGYQLIAQYSGALWTNYNDSDPGITILQSLCYALTELGYKAHLPVEDLLTDQAGNIKIKNQFHLPVDILPVNPVTSMDFSKLILNEVPVLKQVYFTPSNASSFLLSTQPWLELKPEYVTRLSDDIQFGARIVEQVKQLLTRHANVSQLFTTPRLLTPVLINLSGTITINKNTPVEKVIAGILYAGNHYLSPYPVYQSYAEAQARQPDLPAVLDGPYLSNGYIPDACIAVTRKPISGHALGAVCLDVEGVDDATITEPIVITPDADEAYYLTIQSFRGITCYQNGNPVQVFDTDKIQYYLNKLIPVQTAAEAPAALSGTFYDVASYYSIQHSFPAVYQLTGKGPTEPMHAAQVNQLKAYLVLFEQLLGDYLAQLRNIDQLFSFDSGRTDRRLSSPTYFSQPLYTIPGLERVLTGVKNHGYLNDAAPAHDWISYQQDADNPYARQVASVATDDVDNLSRKKRALEHLLARYGKAYDHQPWHLANPRYGEDVLAEIEYLQHTLMSFPLLSANRARTYFRIEGYSSLVSGLALNLENELGITPFLRGIHEALHSSLNTGAGLAVICYDDAGNAVQVFPSPRAAEASSTKKNLREVIWNGDAMLSFASTSPALPMTLPEVRELLTSRLRPIDALINNQTGLLMLDVARLTGFLSFRWTLKDADGKVLYQSSALTVDRLEQRALVLEQGFPLELKEVRKGAEYEIGARTHQQRYLMCERLSSLETAQAVLARLQQLQSVPDREAIVIEAIGPSGHIAMESLQKMLVVVLPDWVALFNQSLYRELFQRKLTQLAPPSAITQLIFLSYEEYPSLLTNHIRWMHGLQAVYDGQLPDPASRAAAWELLATLSNELNTTQA